MGFKIRCALILAVMLLSNYECSADGGTGGTLNDNGGNGAGGDWEPSPLSLSSVKELAKGGKYLPLLPLCDDLAKQ